MFEQIIRNKVRFTGLFQGLSGIITAEDVYDIKKEKIAYAIKQVKESLNKSNDDELSFLLNIKVSEEDKLNQLKFNFLKHVYLTKVTEEEESVNAAAKKARREEILALIAEKEKEENKVKSKEELYKELENL